MKASRSCISAPERWWRSADWMQSAALPLWTVGTERNTQGAGRWVPSSSGWWTRELDFKAIFPSPMGTGFSVSKSSAEDIAPFIFSPPRLSLFSFQFFYFLNKNETWTWLEDDFPLLGGGGGEPEFFNFGRDFRSIFGLITLPIKIRKS